MDFVSVSKRLVVELDGGQHALAKHQDDRRTKELARLGFRVVRFWNVDLESNLNGVLATIEARLRES